MPFKRGHIPWNKGLTKETDPRIKKISEEMSGKNHPFYGKRFSKEYRRKLSETRKGIPLSEEHRRRISEGQMGRDAWNKDVPRSEETRRKLSLAKSGKNHHFYGKHLSEEHRQKLSEALTGRIFSEEHKNKISLNHHDVSGENSPWYGKTGEKAPNWRGGKSFEPYGVEFNDELKEQIRKRDNYQCQIGGKYQEELSRALDVHHIDYNKQNNDPQNLVSLCVSCHAKTNVNRDYWEAYFKCIGPLRGSPPVPLGSPPSQGAPLPLGTPEPVSVLPQGAKDAS